MPSLSVRRMLVVLLAVFCLGVAGPASAIDDYAASQTPSAAAMGIDVALVRPVSFAATVVGTALFVVSLPFSLIGRNVGQAGKRLVVEPGEYTFVRPLGNFQANSPSEE